MSTETSPQGHIFDRLIEAMPAITDAVNAFTLEDNQRTALEALLAAAGVPTAPPGLPEVRTPLAVVPPLPSTDPAERDEHDLPEEAPVAAASTSNDAGGQAGKAKRPRKAAAKKVYSRVKDLNFRPDGKTPLRDFWAEKAPTNNHERNLVIVRYLEDVLEIEKIEVGHVLAGYDEVGVRSPAIPDNSLMVTASQKGWLDTSDMKAIRTTHGGRNAIQYDMPKQTKTKTA